MDSESPSMKLVLQTLRQVADTDATVLILGESGTGKGVAARTIHNCSPRAKEKFVVVNCPSLSAELLESELFGHKKGAFTGAIENKLGRVDQAEGGTVFLDEVGDVPLALQPKLLRFIQDREYERVGDPVTRRANVRIVAATNRDLDEMVKEGRFRERPAVPAQCHHRAHAAVARARRGSVAPCRTVPVALCRKLSPSGTRFQQGCAGRDSCLCVARQYPRIAERGRACGDPVFRHGSRHRPAVDSRNRRAAESRPRIGDALSLEELERTHIRGVMATAASLEAAAKTLGIDVSTLYRKRKQYDL